MRAFRQMNKEEESVKREYKKPVVKFIDYSYDEQVVAESSKVDGLGDGHQINYCTYQSASFNDPCSIMVNSIVGAPICSIQPWSLRG